MPIGAFGGYVLSHFTHPILGGIIAGTVVGILTGIVSSGWVFTKPGPRL
jgi:hypothetical protein